MTTLQWSAPALQDLRRINAWLQTEATPEVAVRTLVAIGERAGSLERFPRIGRAIEGDSVRMLRALATPYLIIYRIGSERLDILRIRHEREDWRTP